MNFFFFFFVVPPECVAGSVEHTSSPISDTSQPRLAHDLQLSDAPDTIASWELPCYWWGRLRPAGGDPGQMRPPVPSRWAAPSFG